MKSVKSLIFILAIFHYANLSGADDLCRQLEDRELTRLGLGTYDRPAADVKKSEKDVYVISSQPEEKNVIGQALTFYTKTGDYGSGFRGIEIFTFGSYPHNQEARELPIMLFPDDAKLRYLDYKAVAGEVPPTLLRVFAGDKYDLTTMGTYLIVLEKNCHAVLAQYFSSDNTPGPIVTSETCKDDRRSLSLTGKLCTLYFSEPQSN